MWQCIWACVIAATTAHCTSEHHFFFFSSKCHQSDRGDFDSVDSDPCKAVLLFAGSRQGVRHEGVWTWTGKWEKKLSRIWKYVNLFDWHWLIDGMHTLGLLNRLSYWFISHRIQTPCGLMRRVLIPCQYEHSKSCDWCLCKNEKIKQTFCFQLELTYWSAIEPF